MRTFSWLVRREFWENRAIWIVPAVIGAALVLAALFGHVEIAELTTPEQRDTVGGMVLFAFGATFFLVMTIYSTWYLLDSLHADRKDRSILFWKSLPISDTATVLSKLFTGLVAIPVVYFIAADVTTLLVTFVISVRSRATFGSALWHPDLWLQLQVLWLYLIATMALWYLPITAWCLAVSAWAKRAVTLWTILPPLALFLLEHWFLRTHVVPDLLYERFIGYIPAAFHDVSDRTRWTPLAIGGDTIDTPGSVWRLLNPAAFVSSMQMWLGVLVGIALIVAAIQLRQRRTEM
jgi:ABC-2 type transport system permease protein